MEHLGTPDNVVVSIQRHLDSSPVNAASHPIGLYVHGDLKLSISFTCSLSYICLYLSIHQSIHKKA